MFQLNKFNKVFIDRYEGKNGLFISLCMGYSGKDGKLYPHKIKQEFGKGNWKDSFFKIPFESEGQLKAFAEWLHETVCTPF